MKSILILLIAAIISPLSAANLPRSIDLMIEKANACSDKNKMGIEFTQFAKKSDSVQYSIGDPEKLLLTFLSSDAEVSKSAFLVARGDGDAATGSNMMFASLAVMMAVDPKLDQEAGADLLMAMIKTASKGDQAKGKGIACKFSVTISQDIGFILTIEPID